jgi:hypothetical protein
MLSLYLCSVVCSAPKFTLSLQKKISPTGEKKRPKQAAYGNDLYFASTRLTA